MRAGPPFTGQIGELSPAAAAMSSLPPASYAITPPPMAPPADRRHTKLPRVASNASISPSRFPVNTRPPAVDVIPATIGLDVCTFHLIAPVFASSAVTQP